MSFSAEESLGERGYEKTRFAPLHFSLEEIKYRFDKDIEVLKNQFETVLVLESQQKHREAQDVLRSQIVFCEGVFDFFLHEVSKLVAFELFTEQRKPVDSFSNIKLTLNVGELKYLLGSEKTEEDFYTIVNSKFSAETYMSRDNLSTQLKIIGVSFKDVSKDTFGSVAKGKNFLQDFHIRRNQIAHQMDRSHLNSEQTPIDSQYVKNCIDNISNLSDSIFSKLSS